MYKFLLSAFSFVTIGLASPTPNESYKQTCKDVRKTNNGEGGGIWGNCQRKDGSWRGTDLPNVGRCIGDIKNNDSKLQCEQSPPLPKGSYLESCDNISHDHVVKKIDLNCENERKEFPRISFNYGHCEEGTIENKNGTLQCKAQNVKSPNTAQEALDLGPIPITMELARQEDRPYAWGACGNFASSWNDKVYYYKKDGQYTLGKTFSERIHGMFPIGDDVLFASPEGGIYLVQDKDAIQKMQNGQDPFYKVGEFESNSNPHTNLGNIYWKDGILHIIHHINGKTYYRKYALSAEMIKSGKNNGMLQKLPEEVQNNGIWSVVPFSKTTTLHSVFGQPLIHIVQSGEIVKTIDIRTFGNGKIAGGAKLSAGLAYDEKRNILYVGDFGNKQIHSFHLGAGQDWTYLGSVMSGGVESIHWKDDRLYVGTWHDQQYAKFFEYNLRYADSTGIDAVIVKKTYAEPAHQAFALVKNYGLMDTQNKILYQPEGGRYQDLSIPVNDRWNRPHILLPVQNADPKDALTVNNLTGEVQRLQGIEKARKTIGKVEPVPNGEWWDGEWDGKTLYLTSMQKGTVAAYTLTPDMINQENNNLLQKKWEMTPWNKRFGDWDGTAGIASGKNGFIYTTAYAHQNKTDLVILKDNGNSASVVKTIDLQTLGGFVMDPWFKGTGSITYDRDTDVLYVSSERMNCIFMYKVAEDGVTLTLLGNIPATMGHLIKIYPKTDKIKELGTGSYWEFSTNESSPFTGRNRQGSQYLKYEIQYVKGCKGFIAAMHQSSKAIDVLLDKAKTLSETKETSVEALQKALDEMKAINKSIETEKIKASKAFDNMMQATKEYGDHPTIRKFIENGKHLKNEIFDDDMRYKEYCHMLEEKLLEAQKKAGQEKEALLKMVKDKATETKTAYDAGLKTYTDLKTGLSSQDVKALTEFMKAINEKQTGLQTQTEKIQDHNKNLPALAKPVESDPSVKPLLEGVSAQNKDSTQWLQDVKTLKEKAQKLLEAAAAEAKALEVASKIFKDMESKVKAAEENLSKAKTASDINGKKPEEIKAQAKVIDDLSQSVMSLVAGLGGDLSALEKALGESYKAKGQSMLTEGPKMIEKVKSISEEMKKLSAAMTEALAKSLSEEERKTKITDMLKSLDVQKSLSEEMLKSTQSLATSIEKGVTAGKFQEVDQEYQALLKTTPQALGQVVDMIIGQCTTLAGTSAPLKALVEDKKTVVETTHGVLKKTEELIAKTKDLVTKSENAKKDLEEKRKQAEDIKDALNKNATKVCTAVDASQEMKEKKQDASKDQETKDLFASMEKDYGSFNQVLGSLQGEGLDDLRTTAKGAFDKGGLCIKKLGVEFKVKVDPVPATPVPATPQPAGPQSQEEESSSNPEDMASN